MRAFFSSSHKNAPQPAPSSNDDAINDILRKVSRIELSANRRVNDVFAGQYHSVFRGRGMEFDEVREYQPGDDVRAIDWNVTARAGSPFIKRFHEERELTVVFLVDVSASGVFGSRDRSKLELATEVAAILMFSALKNNDKVGLIRFADEVVSYDPPRKGKSNVLRLIRELVSARPVARRTDLKAPLDYLNRVQKRRGTAFLISDFLAPLPAAALAVTNRRHDLVAITIKDPREESLPDVGFVTLRDAETGEQVEVDTSSRRVRLAYAARSLDRQRQLRETLRRAAVDELSISTAGDAVRALRRFFVQRERRFR